MAKRIGYKFTVRHMTTGADYSGVIFCKNLEHAAERALAHTALSLAIDGYGRKAMTRIVELREATEEEVAAKRARIAAL